MSDDEGNHESEANVATDDAKVEKGEGMSMSDETKIAAGGALLVLGLLLTFSLFAVGFGGEAKVEKALEFTKALAGILVTVGGVVGTSVSMLKASANDQNIFASTGPGLVGVLAGTALLGVEQWAVPAALGVAGLGVGIGYGLSHFR